MPSFDKLLKLGIFYFQSLKIPKTKKRKSLSSKIERCYSLCKTWQLLDSSVVIQVERPVKDGVFFYRVYL